MTDSEPVSYGNNRVDSAQIVRWVIVAVIVVAIVALALDNRHDVRLGFVFGDGNAPAWIVVIASGIGGIVIGWLIKHRPGRHR